MALTLEFGEKSLATEKLDQRLLALGDDDARVQRRAVAGIGDREGEAAGALQVVEIAHLVAACADVDRCRVAARVVPARGVQRIFARRELQAIGAFVSHYPGVRLAVPFCDDDGLSERFVIAGADCAPHRAGGQVPSLDLGPDDGSEVSARPHLQPPGERAAFMRLQRVQLEQIARPGTDVIEVGSVQRYRPAGVVGHHAIGECAVGLAFAESGETWNSEQEAASRPQCQTREQVGQGLVPAVGHGGTYLDLIGVCGERVDRHDVHLAPVAHGADAHLLRAALQDVHVLIGVGPRRPVVRDEVGECDAIATDMAVTDRRDVHDRAARHAERHGGLDRQCEGQFFVDDREVTGCPGVAVRNRRGAGQHPDRRVRTGQRCQRAEQHCAGGAPQCDYGCSQGQRRDAYTDPILADFVRRRRPAHAASVTSAGSSTRRARPPPEPGLRHLCRHRPAQEPQPGRRCSPTEPHRGPPQPVI